MPSMHRALDVIPSVQGICRQIHHLMSSQVEHAPSRDDVSSAWVTKLVQPVCSTDSVNCTSKMGAGTEEVRADRVRDRDRSASSTTHSAWFPGCQPFLFSIFSPIFRGSESTGAPWELQVSLRTSWQDHEDWRVPGLTVRLGLEMLLAALQG